MDSFPPFNLLLCSSLALLDLSFSLQTPLAVPKDPRTRAAKVDTQSWYFFNSATTQLQPHPQPQPRRLPWLSLSLALSTFLVLCCFTNCLSLCGLDLPHPCGFILLSTSILDKKNNTPLALPQRGLLDPDLDLELQLRPRRSVPQTSPDEPIKPRCRMSVIEAL